MNTAANFSTIINRKGTKKKWKKRFRHADVNKNQLLSH